MNKVNIPANDVFSKIPLYAPIDLSSLSSGEKLQVVETIRFPETSIDSYCIGCQVDSTFKLSSTTLRIAQRDLLDEQVFNVELECSRNKRHRIYFIFFNDNDQIIKIGQFPSLATLDAEKIKSYRGILSKEKFGEFSRAIGLSAHGIGIGAFVYLRRIFEDLIEEAHIHAREEVALWDENAYQGAHVSEKISILRDFLPSFLVENSQLYGILSKGIHSLSEAECLQYFDVVKLGIELILDEKLEKKAKAEKIKMAKKAIGTIRQEISQS